MWRREKWGGEGGRGEGEGVVPRSAEPLWLSKPGTGTGSRGGKVRMKEMRDADSAEPLRLSKAGPELG